MAEKVEAFLVAYSSQERANSAPEFRNCALGGLSEERFEFAENLLDRVEIRRIRWQIERGRTHTPLAAPTLLRRVHKPHC